MELQTAEWTETALRLHDPRYTGETRGEARRGESQDGPLQRKAKLEFCGYWGRLVAGATKCHLRREGTPGNLAAFPFLLRPKGAFVVV